MDKPFRGIFSIAQTPFSDAGDILWDDFEYELENAIMGLPGRVMACKEVLVRRGVLSNSAVRGRGALRLDDHDRAALDYALSLVEPFFRVESTRK